MWPGLQSLAQLHSEFKASKSHRRPCEKAEGKREGKELGAVRDIPCTTYNISTHGETADAVALAALHIVLCCYCLVVGCRLLTPQGPRDAHGNSLHS